MGTGHNIKEIQQIKDKKKYWDHFGIFKIYKKVMLLDTSAPLLKLLGGLSIDEHVITGVLARLILGCMTQ